MTAHTALVLQVWLGPGFPVGAFAYSHGLEWAYEAGEFSDAKACGVWIEDVIRYGSGRSDAIFLAHAYRAMKAFDGRAFVELADLASALQPSAERHLESTMQGNAFVAVSKAAWPNDVWDRLDGVYEGDICYPLAVGTAAAGFDMKLLDVLNAYLLAVVTNLVSAAIRLGVMGQTDGQRVIASLVPIVKDIARYAENAGLDDLGTSTFRSDLASLQHETQYTRLFRS